MRASARAVAGLVVLLVLAIGIVDARAQDVPGHFPPRPAPAPADVSHWGVSASVVPRWQFFQPLADVMDIETDLRGAGFTLGLVRGRDLGGDWGVSLVKKTVTEGAFVQLLETACLETPAGQRCARGTYHVAYDAALLGVELHTFVPFGTIAGRLQIGVVFAGGVGQIEGTSERFREHLEITGSGVTAVTESLGTGPFKEAFSSLDDLEVVPIGRVELAVAVIARPGLKFRLAGGANFPGYHVAGVTVQYLFGAR